MPSVHASVYHIHSHSPCAVRQRTMAREFKDELMRLPGAEELFGPGKDLGDVRVTVYGGAVRNHFQGTLKLEEYVARGGDIDASVHVESRSFAFALKKLHEDGTGWTVRYLGNDYLRIPSYDDGCVDALDGWYSVQLKRGDSIVKYDLNVSRSHVALNVVPDYTVNGLGVTIHPQHPPVLVSFAGVGIDVALGHIKDRLLVAVAPADDKRIQRGDRLGTLYGYKR